MNLFSNDSFLGRFLDRVSSFVLLNLYFMICALPVITAGASFTALYYSVLKLHKDGEVSVTRLFFTSDPSAAFDCMAGALLLSSGGLSFWAFVFHQYPNPFICGRDIIFISVPGNCGLFQFLKSPAVPRLLFCFSQNRLLNCRGSHYLSPYVFYPGGCPDVSVVSPVLAAVRIFCYRLAQRMVFLSAVPSPFRSSGYCKRI